jgi:FkbM family methyltransferase
LLRVTNPEIIGFDPLEERLRERADAEQGFDLTLLPYAIGDGEKHTLYINDIDATSSLFPLNHATTAGLNDVSDRSTIATREVSTHRLDDVLPMGPVDLLKLDVQGAELMVLRGAERTLTSTAVVQCEAMFSPMYLGQPLFGDIQKHLLEKGFQLIDVLIPHRHHYLTPSGRMTQDRLLWADAVFIHETEDTETLYIQALIAAGMYRKPTLAEHLMVQAESGAPLQL